MTGARLTLELQDREIRAALREWRITGRNPVPMFRAIGTRLVSNTQDRFDAETAPDGTPWKPVQEPWASMKRGAGILRESAMRGGLQGFITFDVAGGELAVGSNKIYAAVHQFGATIRPKSGPWLIFRTPGGRAFGAAHQVTIPARPYLGLSATDQEDILDTVEFFLARRH